MPGSRIAFIVPIFNRLDLAVPLLHALAATTADSGDHEYHVIDDGCEPAARDVLARLDPLFRLRQNPANLGFARSVNLAVAACDAPWVCLVNSDLVLEENWFDPMARALEERPAAFAVGNVHVAATDGRLDHAGIVFHEEGFPIHCRAEGDAGFVERAGCREFPAVSAACVLIRRDRFLALGGFDESYRNGFEDVDLCLRARLRGWPSYVANQSRVGHHISASPGRKDHEEENARRFLQRWRPLTRVWQRDWENRLLRERRAHAGELPPAPAAVDRSRTRLRVLVDLARLGPGGSNGGIKVLVRALLAGLHETSPAEFSFLLVVPDEVAAEAVAWTGARDEIWILPPTGTVVAPVLDGRARRLPTADATLARLLDADVLYCPLGVSDFLTPDLPAIGVAVDLLHREVPACLPARDVAARDDWHDRMVRTSHRIQCNSQWVADRMRHHFGATPEQLFVVHNAVHTRLGPLPPRDEAAAPFFFYPANAWPHKNHDTLLVAHRLHLEGSTTGSWPLVLTGHRDAAMERIEARARALGIGERVQVRGFVDDAELARLWSGAGALVFPSLHEGFGIPVLEAMHFGVPVVAGRVASIPEVAGDACHYTDVRDPRALAGAMTRIASDVTLRADLAARGRRRAAAFTFAPGVATLASVLRDAVEAFRAARITWRWEQPAR